MSHEFNHLRSHKHERDRVSKITGVSSAERTVGGMCGKMRARGGKVEGGEAPALRADGGTVLARGDKAVRRARGGRTGKHSGKTNVNVIVAPGHGAGAPPMAGGMPPMMPPKPPMAAAPPPPPPAGPPPVAGLGGMPPHPGMGMPPPGMPPRSVGGRAYKKGGAVKDKMSGEKKHGKHEKPYKMRADGGQTKEDVEYDVARTKRPDQNQGQGPTRDNAARQRADGGKTQGQGEYGLPMPRPRPQGKEPQPSDMYDPKDAKTLEDQSKKEMGLPPSMQRAKGGNVTAGSIGTRVQHSGNKSDTQNIGRGPVITKATGGPIRSEDMPKKGSLPKTLKGDALFSHNAPKSPKWHGGSGGATERKAIAKRYNPAGHEPWNKDYAT